VVHPLEAFWPLSVIAAPLSRADAIQCERQPAGIVLVDSLARYRSACSRACRTRNGQVCWVREIRRAACRVAGGLLVAQNIVTAVRDCIAGRAGAASARSASEEGAMSELDRLEAAMNECREMVREAHAATKDLRAAVREARQELRTLARDQVAAQIQPEVSRQLEELGERTGEAITAATQKVIAEFDRFGESLLGKETYWQKASGRRAVARPDTEVVPPGTLPSEEES
jgi:chromosome segregation ATPase